MIVGGWLCYAVLRCVDVDVDVENTPSGRRRRRRRRAASVTMTTIELPPAKCLRSRSNCCVGDDVPST